MINNRSSSRRRGRGGSSQARSSGGGSSGQRDSGNRIDSRTRGNAAQLLEKYKNMARDAQMSGDRVQVEYYLQFADHYFRVLADSRARSDDHRPIRPVDDFDGSDEEYGDEGEPIRAGEQGDARPQQQPYQQNGRDNQQPRRDDGRREDNRRDEPRREDTRRAEGQRDDARRDDRQRDDRQRRDAQSREDRAEQGNREERAEQPQPNGHDYRERVANDLDEAAPAAVEAEAKPSARRPSRSRKPAPAPAVNEAAEPFDADRLPPALGIAPIAEQPAEATEDAPKPRRRRSTKPSEAQAG